ncbi:acid protease [Daldinia vernicosa]|uniref:acid protease n=1 Tax=Daldinia vernicosa TaxID=114800 RepID=UPI00200786D4|nr:acid protease [Daldinia vernicosa]KAI0848771.1 acid protease [Daldinia vernicosa]
MSFSHPLFFIAASTLIGVGRAVTFKLFNGTHGGPVNATSLPKSTHEVLSLPLRKIEHKGVGTPSLARRYFGSDVLGLYGAAYFAELTIGTSDNPQTVNVLLDTGSFELWVNPDCSATNVRQFCGELGHYDPTLSSTSKNLNQTFKIQYGLGSASGTYHQDDVFISGAKLPGQQFGVSNTSSDVWFGILGLGHGKGHGVIDYESIVDSLATQGFTDSKLFSLDLGGQPGPTAAITGEMVFGGVDTNKYAGNLAKVPTDSNDAHYVATLNSISLQVPASASGSVNTISQSIKAINDSNLPLQVIVDSGTTLSLLPESMVSAIAAGFPGAEPDGNGGYKVPCELRNTTEGRVDFELRGDGNDKVKISVSYNDFIWYGGNECFLGVRYTSDVGVWILGDTFLRGAYVTFDQSNNALYMANYVSCGQGSNLVPVPAGPDAAANIPGSCETAEPAQKVPSPAATLASYDPECDCTVFSFSTAFSTAFMTSTATATTATIKKHASPVPMPSSPAPEDDDCDEDQNQDQPQEKHVEIITATETFTSTLVRHVVYTAGRRVATSHVTVVTTFCPGDILFPASTTPIPGATHSQTQGRVQHTTTRPILSTSISPPIEQVTIAEITHAVKTAPETFITTRNTTTTQVATELESVRANTYSSPPPHWTPPTFTESILSTFPFSPPTFSSYSSPLPPPPPPPSPHQQQSAVPNAGFGATGWGFNNTSITTASTNTNTGNLDYNAAAGVATVGGAASQAIGAGAGAGAVVAPAVPTTTKTTQVWHSPMPSGMAMSTSEAVKKTLGEVAIGLWTVMMVMVIGQAVGYMSLA